MNSSCSKCTRDDPWRWNRGLPTDLAYYRDARGTEIDLVVEKALDPIAVEIKAGQTPSFDVGAVFASFEGILRATPSSARSVERRVVYGGERSVDVDAVRHLAWREVDQAGWG